MVGGVKALVPAIVLAALAAGSAFAQALPDPTRPPPALDVTAGGAGAAAVPVGLQSIIRREGGKPAAIIHGQYVELGGLVGEAKLVKVNDDSVVLQGPMGKETLFLTPNVEKKVPVAATEPAKGRKGGRTRTKDGAGK